MREIKKKARYPSQWEELFGVWSSPPGRAEQERCDRTIREVQEAIRMNPKLASLNVQTFVQGSYANRTNVREDSDVDVCVYHNGVFFKELSDGLSEDDFSFGPPDITFEEYKTEVHRAMIARFGNLAVERKDRSIKVNAESYRVDADVVPTFQFRQYYREYGAAKFHSGTSLKCDNDGKIVSNFPIQHIERGKEKNNATNRRYREQVRIFKTFRNNLIAWSDAAEDQTSSFGLESLIWNVPEQRFSGQSHCDRFQKVIFSAHEAVSDPMSAQRLFEANGVKRLFGQHNKHTPRDYEVLLRAIWRAYDAKPV